jgi:predicted GNAT superfamily acetyltransferase
LLPINALVSWSLQTPHFDCKSLIAKIHRTQLRLPNFYGRTSSPLHAGVSTDRLVAEWWVRSEQAQDLLDGKKPKAGSDRVRIRIPAGIRQITSSDPAEAERIQLDVRTQFERHIAEGRAAVGFELDAQQGSYVLVLEPYED